MTSLSYYSEKIPAFQQHPGRKKSCCVHKAFLQFDELHIWLSSLLCKLIFYCCYIQKTKQKNKVVKRLCDPFSWFCWSDVETLMTATTCKQLIIAYCNIKTMFPKCIPATIYLQHILENSGGGREGGIRPGERKTLAVPVIWWAHTTK